MKITAREFDQFWDEVMSGPSEWAIEDDRYNQPDNAPPETIINIPRNMYADRYPPCIPEPGDPDGEGYWPAYSDRCNLTRAIKIWRERRTQATILVTCDKSALEAVRAAIVAAGGEIAE
jgi:hypothetical protein